MGPDAMRLTGDVGREREYVGAMKGLESKGAVTFDLVLGREGGRRDGEAMEAALKAARKDGVNGVFASERERWREGVFGNMKELNTKRTSFGVPRFGHLILVQFLQI